MSDSESIESQTETEQFTDNEDIVERCSVVQPYQFEPVADIVTMRKKKQTRTAFYAKLSRQDLRKP